MRKSIGWWLVGWLAGWPAGWPAGWVVAVGSMVVFRLYFTAFCEYRVYFCCYLHELATLRVIFAAICYSWRAQCHFVLLFTAVGEQGFIFCGYLLYLVSMELMFTAILPTGI